MIRHPRPLVGLAAAGALSLPVFAASVPAAGPTPAAAPLPRGGEAPALTLAAYQSLSASQSRNYDRTQDITPRQMLILLEVAERTETSLGQALATGELESARTWNDHVRPTLRSGSLGAAAGVWQFMPGTFHMVIKKYGTQLLAASDADPATGRDRLDLAAGPFSDARVRAIIQQTADGKRGADDEELKLLRHNFAVLAFAKHYLSVDSGATTPVEDYLFHFLGTAQGRRVLTLAHGEARDTLCVKLPPPAPPKEPIEAPLDPAAGGPTAPRAAAILPPVPPLLARPAVFTPPPSVPPPAPLGATRRGEGPGPGNRNALVAKLRAAGAFEAAPAPAIPPDFAPTATPATFTPPPPPPVSSEWGLPADSATVTGNLGMFYRDGKGQSQPYTWGGFLDNLARRVRAKDQPALVRAKYGVGFGLKGGDLPERAFDPEHSGDPVEFRPGPEHAVLVPEALILGPLDREETRQYKARLAALVAQEEDRPSATLPPEAVAALRGLRFLPPKVQESATTNPQVQKALLAFRNKVGKDAPDDPAQVNLLMPTERIALEVYGRRLARYAQLQAGQQASLATAPDLNRIRKLSARSQQRAAPHIATVQAALATRGLLTPPTQKVVWHDQKRRKHVEYRPGPFPGKPDRATVTALNSFQWRNGLRKTDGVLDTVTLTQLGLPPLGPEVVLPLAGPQCDFRGWAPLPAMSETPLPALPPPAPAAPIPPRVSWPRSISVDAAP